MEYVGACPATGEYSVYAAVVGLGVKAEAIWLPTEVRPLLSVLADATCPAAVALADPVNPAAVALAAPTVPPAR